MRSQMNGAVSKVNKKFISHLTLAKRTPKERNRMVLDPAKGVAKGEGGCLLLQHVRSSAVEEHD